MKAALLEKPESRPQMVEDLVCASPQAGQVKVKITHCGICHSDLSLIESTAVQVPIVLGHEAAGIVTDVGAGVSSLVEGDSVMISPLAPCGRCYYCVRGDAVLCVDSIALFSGLFPDGTSPFSRDGELVYRGLGVGGFASETVVVENGAMKMDPDIDRGIASVMGCAVQTGVGAVLNTAKMEPGATALVMGLGGIGMSVVLGTQVAGASRVIVSDPIKERRELALELGATEALDPTESDVSEFTRDLTGGIGVDYAFDAAGNTDLISAGLKAARNGGLVAMVGVPSFDSTLVLPDIVAVMAGEKKLVGCLFGSSDSRREVPRLLSLYRAGKLNLDALITQRRAIEDINVGLDDMSAGTGLRTILEF